MSYKKLKNIVKTWTNYDPKITNALTDKCARQTKVGRLANLALKLIFSLLLPIKHLRRKIQKILGVKHEEMKLFPLEGPLYAAPIAHYTLPRILIIAELSIPQCTRYRVHQKKKALETLGFEVMIVSFAEYQKCLGLLPLCSAVFFYRTPLWPPVKALIEECKRQSVVTIYDIDDLVFDVEEYKRHPVIREMSEAERENMLDGARAYRDCLASTDHAVASTRVLAKFMQKYCKGKVFILENALDDLALEVCALTNGLTRAEKTEKITIGYGSGTKSHDQDFALVSEALSSLMRKDARVQLVIHGYLNLSNDFEMLETRIHRVPFLEAKEYLAAVSQFDINLAPLVANVFNNAKSNIKFIEAAAVGVPSIVSPATSFLDIAVDNETALIATSAEEWHSALGRLVNSKELREKLGGRAREAVNAKYSPEKTTEHLAKILSDLGITPIGKNVKARRRVLLVNCLFHPSSFGGATLVVEQLARNLINTMEVGVFTLNQFEQLEDYGLVRYAACEAQVFSVRFPIERFHAINWNDPRMDQVFSDVISAFKPDVIHFHAVQGIGAGAVKAAKNSGAKVIITMHDAWWLCERQFMMTPAGKWCGQTSIDVRACVSKCSSDSAVTYKRYFDLRAAVGLADAVLAPSQWHVDLMTSSLGRPVRLNKNGTVKPKGIVPKKRNSMLTFVFVGGGDATHKGYYAIKRVFEDLPRNDYRLVLVDIHKKLGLSKIKSKDWNIRGDLLIAEPYNYETIDAFFTGIDILLCPTIVPESFGMAVREATARGVWVIAMNAGGMTEDLVPGKNGSVTPMGDFESFEKAVHDSFNLDLSTFAQADASNIHSFPAQAAELTENFYN